MIYTIAFCIWLGVIGCVGFELLARHREKVRDTRIEPWRPKNQIILPPIARSRRGKS